MKLLFLALFFSNILLASDFESTLNALKMSRDELLFIIKDQDGYLKSSSQILANRIDSLLLEIEEDEEGNEKSNNNLVLVQIEDLRTILERVTLDLELYYPNSMAIKEALSMERLLDQMSESLDSQLMDDELRATSQKRIGKIKFKTALDACYSLALPGDILLRRALLTEGTTDDDFGPKTMALIKALETLKGNDTKLTYRHSELIIDLPHYNNIVTLSYYPWQFNWGKPKEEKMPLFLTIDNHYQEYINYRSKFSIFKVKAKNSGKAIKKKERALERAAKRDLFLTLGTCADFVNWTYYSAITSNWNRVPVLRHAIALLYFPEGIDTPDDLADSYMTDKVCDVENSKLIYPTIIDMSHWVQELVSGKKSSSAKIRAHSEKIFNKLKQDKLIKEDGTPLYDLLEVDFFKIGR